MRALDGRTTLPVTMMVLVSATLTVAACSSTVTAGSHGNGGGGAGGGVTTGGAATAGAQSSGGSGGAATGGNGGATGGSGGAATGGSGGAATGGSGGAATGGSSGAATGGSSGAVTGGSGGAATGGSGGATGGNGGAATGGSGGNGVSSDVVSCAGNLACGSDSCCESPLVNGCTNCNVPNGNATTLPDFRLDKYEVTVGRFRSFLDAYVWPPAAGTGAHLGAPTTGWQSTWNGYIASSKTELASLMALRPCEPLTNRTWTEAAGANESKPMNCVTWYEAFAFCAWDGGYLPTEMEWQYAAGGGDENRAYPWIGTVVDIDHALFGYCGNGVSSLCTVDAIADVGSKLPGAGRWGQLDLAGSMWEWVFDTYGPFPAANPCSSCFTDDGGTTREIRGGSWYEDSSYLPVAQRGGDLATSSWHNVGIRCARNP